MRVEDLRAALKSRYYTVTYVNETDSTNSALRRAADAGAPFGSVLVASRQTAGRGRTGRSFFSPADTGVYLSVLLPPATDPARLTVTAAVAAKSALRRIFGVTVQVKWVNDLYLSGKKVAGILAECGEDPTGRRYAVLGLGVNLLPPRDGFPADLADKAGAVATFLPPAGAERFCAAFLEEVEACGEWDEILKEYTADFFLSGKDVLVPGRFSAPVRVLGVDENARLRVRLADGTETVLGSGEVIDIR